MATKNNRLNNQTSSLFVKIVEIFFSVLNDKTFLISDLTFQGMIALRREATELDHEDYMDAIIEVQAKKKANLMYYA